MSQAINGVATNFTTKSITSRKGNNVTIHFVHVDTFDEPLNVGFKQPYKLGDKVVGAAETAYGEWKLQPGVIATGSKPVPTNTGGGKSYGNAPFPVPPLHPENRIMRQNALAHASRLVAARLDSASTSCTNDDMANDTIDIANQLVRWSTGRAELEAMESLEKVGNTE